MILSGILWENDHSIQEGHHSILACVYTRKYGPPEFSIHYTIIVKTDPMDPIEPVDPTESVPTIPPRVAPTVPPKKEESSSYCGDEKCDSSESCQSCPLDCGLCSDYSCSSQVCSLPLCQCATTSLPSDNRPQFVSITWDDAQTPTTFPHVMSVSRSSSVFSPSFLLFIDPRFFWMCS